MGETLFELGLVAEEQLLPFIEAKLGVPAVRLREGLSTPVVTLIPQEQRIAWACWPCSRSANADRGHGRTAEPAAHRRNRTRHRPDGAAGLRVRASIRRMLERCYEEDFEVDAVTADLDESAVELQADAIDVDLTAVEELVDGSPVINLVNYLILQAIRKGASDIHIEPSRKYTHRAVPRRRPAVEVLRPRRDIHPAIVSRIKVMGKMDIAEHRLPQDGRCQVMVDGKEVDLRISTLPTVLGEKVVMRVLDRSGSPSTSKRWGCPGRRWPTSNGCWPSPTGWCW